MRERHGLATELKRPFVERLREEGLVPKKHDVAGRRAFAASVGGAKSRGDQSIRPGGTRILVESTEVHPGLFRRGPRDAEVQEVAAVRQERWQHMQAFALGRIEARHLGSRAAGGRAPQQSTSSLADHNHAVRIPRAADAAARQVTHRLGSAPPDVYPHEWTGRAERDGLTIGRPEHGGSQTTDRDLGAGERARHLGVHAPNPQASHPVRPGSGKHQLLAVRRHRECRRLCQLNTRRDLGSNDRGSGHGPARNCQPHDAAGAHDARGEPCGRPQRRAREGCPNRRRGWRQGRVAARLERRTSTDGFCHRRLYQGRSEPVPPFGDRFDVLAIVCRVAQRLAECEHVVGQVRFLDEGIRPHLL